MLQNKILIIFFLLLFVSVANADPKCDFCSNDLSGSYFRGADGESYCSDCFNKYSRCAGCGKLKKSMLTINSIDFCPDCYVDLKQCDLCGKSIVGAYNYYPDLAINVCADCEKNKARCQVCDRPAKHLTRIKDKALCESCVSRSERCYSCGGAITRDYNFYEGDDSKKYCRECVNTYQGCSDCGAPSGPRSFELDDGRFLCPDCRSMALFDPALITPIKNSAILFLDQVLGMRIKHEINYSLQDRHFLNKKSNDSDKELNGLFHRKGDDYKIYVLYGLRKNDLIGVLVHEITHAWESENCDEDLDLLDREGFAQWTAYHALIHNGYRKLAESLLVGDNIYTNGLKKMINIENSGGRAAVLEFIQKK